jgi:hypothetical protein
MSDMKRPVLPDLPTFARPPFRVCKHTAKIYGVDEFGGSCMIADMRGWGYLTGQGQALALSSKDAFKAQLKTAEFIVEAMNAAISEHQQDTSPADGRACENRIAKNRNRD